MLRTAFIVLAIVAGSVTASAGTPARFALVVGNNHPLPGSGYDPLQYADDDALRFAAFMKRVGADVRLFTGPDPTSAERFGLLAQSARPPRRALIVEALEQLEVALRAAEGQQREVFIYFSGHGSVTSSKAYLHLLDGGFSRTDMRSLVLDRLSAERVHIIVDSCHAYFMVNPRGERVLADADDGGLERYPQAGFLLSTSAKKEVQEWSGYEGGVFSYQLLGAMQGAADVNLDGKVSYAEAHAYVVAANAGVDNAAARVQPFVRRPVVGEPVLIELAAGPELARVEVPGDLAGHLHVVDGRGRRLLDANKPLGHPLGLFVPAEPGLVVWMGDRAYGWATTEAPGVLSQLQGEGNLPDVSSRGPVADEFRKNLFRRPLTQEFVAGLDAAVSFYAPSPSVSIGFKQEGLHPASVGLFAGGGAGIVVGAIAAGIFVKARADASPEVFTDANAQMVQSARHRAEDSRMAMVGGFVGGAALIAAGLVYELVRDGGAPARLVRFGPGPGANGLAVGWDR